ncbi:cytochrome b/b6 domain-containing protein [Tropicimonas marinistellae]|uniref:cytochrome b/b6 domain-containing protein n=1 Tax=Tropicimonas marinistellae TaxID=1739787 RepID=UPI0009900695|nr:cytochrome b/b6 domain-containing protein [Tropicimonas marinistellae]
MTNGSPGSGKLTRVRLWDPGIRLFHWALAICVATAWFLGEFGPGIMTLHFYFGYAVIGLLVFRLIWGLVGPWPARFRDFVYSPATFIAYLRGIRARTPSFWAGHNPMGAVSVFALLGVLGLQAYTGLFSDPDDFINKGPLADSVSGSWVNWATGWHNALPPLILLLVLLHVGSIVYYRVWKGEDLVTPMIHGKKTVLGDVPEDRIIETIDGAAETGTRHSDAA